MPKESIIWYLGRKLGVGHSWLFEYNDRSIKQWFDLLNKTVGTDIIDPKSRLYLLKELSRHKKNLQWWHGVFKPDIHALLENYNKKINDYYNKHP